VKYSTAPKETFWTLYAMSSMRTKLSLLSLCQMCFAGCFCFILTSCGGINKELEVERLDSLYSVLKNCDTLLSTIDSAKVDSVVTILQSQVDMVLESKKDSLSEQQAEFMNRYYALARPLSIFLNKRTELSKEINLQERQLLTLKSDVQNNRLDIESYNKYITSEEENTKTIKNNVELLVKNTNDNLVSFYTWNPELEQLLDLY